MSTPSRRARRKPTKNAAASCASRTRSAASRPAWPRSAAARVKPLPTDDCTAIATLRYFLDTEFNGVGGTLLSLALVPDDGDDLYLTLQSEEPLVEWVERHVVPYLDTVPEQLSCPRLNRRGCGTARSNAIFAMTNEPLILADWPEDIAQFCDLLVTGPGGMVELAQPYVPLRRR